MSKSGPGPRNNRSRWTLSDLRYLEQQYCTRPLAELADFLGRSPGAVALMADKLDCRRQKNLPWTDAEIDIIRQHYGSGVGAEFLQALLPGRSVPAIFSMAEKMGVLSGRFWLEEELDILMAYYPDEGTAITARLPGRTVNAVRVMARRLGLKKSAVSTSGFRPWSEEEWQTLKDNMHMSISEQQRILFPDRTTRAVEKARERLKRKQRGGAGESRCLNKKKGNHVSARERFFKKVQQQNTPPLTDGSVEADIRVFCQRMDELAHQVQQWFDGSGITVIAGVKSLSDLSTVGRSLNSGASRYDITTIRLQNDIRSVSIQPEQLYQKGCKGCVTLTVNAPDRKPGRQQFYLSMKPEGGWFIREEQHTGTIKSTLTEDVFFRVIDSLA